MLEWQVNSLGGFLTTPELSQQMRVKAQTRQRFRNLVTPEEAFGMNRGDTLQFTKAGNADDGRVVAETEQVPTSNLSFTKSTVVAQEFTLGIDYSWRLDTLAKLDVYNNIIVALTNSMSRTLDRAAGAVFQTADLVYTPTGTEANPTYSLGSAGLALSLAGRRFMMWDHKNMIDLMGGTYNMPVYDDVGYVAVGGVKFLRGLGDDGAWERVIAPQNAGRAFRGEVGEYYQARFIQETNVLSNTMGTGGVLGEAIYIGADAVIEIVVAPEEIQAKLGSDYGRDRGMRWVYYGNWAKSWNYAIELEARMMRVASL